MRNYPNITQYLSPFYGVDGRNFIFPLFNFQGFISVENREQFRLLELPSVENFYSRHLINVNYDENNLYINFLYPAKEMESLKIQVDSYIQHKAITKEQCYA